MSHAHQYSSAQVENAATEMKHSTMRSLPFSLPTWISWLYRRYLTMDRLLDYGASCIAIFPTSWVMLGGMAGKVAAPGSNSWTVGSCWQAATQSWMHDTSATPMAEGKMHWRPRGRCLPRFDFIISLFFCFVVIVMRHRFLFSRSAELCEVADFQLQSRDHWFGFWEDGLLFKRSSNISCIWPFLKCFSLPFEDI